MRTEPENSLWAPSRGQVFKEWVKTWQDDQRDGSVDKSTSWTSRGPRFISQHVCGSLKLFVTPITRNKMPSSGFYEYQERMRYTDVLECKIPIHIKLNFNFKNCRVSSKSNQKQSWPNPLLPLLTSPPTLLLCPIPIHPRQISSTRVQVMPLKRTTTGHASQENKCRPHQPEKHTTPARRTERQTQAETHLGTRVHTGHQNSI